jgi:hypothetical protein
MKRITLIIVSALLALPASAQSLFHATAAVTASSGGSAYVTPKVALNFEPRWEWKRIGIAGAINVIPTGKIDTRDGVTAGTRGEVDWRVRGWNFGAGASYGHVWTSRYDKGAWHPLLAGGWRDEEMDIQVRYLLPQGDRRNGATGPQFAADFWLNKHFGMRIVGEVISSFPTDEPLRGRTVYTSGGAGVAWRIK